MSMASSKFSLDDGRAGRLGEPDDLLHPRDAHDALAADLRMAMRLDEHSAKPLVIFASRTYGERTNDMFDTGRERDYVLSKRKPFFLIRMIPFGQDFEHGQARFMFGLNKLVLPWMVGTPMPAELPDKIIEALELPSSLVPGARARRALHVVLNGIDTMDSEALGRGMRLLFTLGMVTLQRLLSAEQKQ